MSCGIYLACGISSRFQLLSPSIGQVTHALLTRPPLSHLNRIHPQQAASFFGRGASFDLHVLSTPPAFILSQDQTLKLSFEPSSKCLHLRCWHIFRFLVVSFSKLKFQRNFWCACTIFLVHLLLPKIQPDCLQSDIVFEFSGLFHCSVIKVRTLCFPGLRRFTHRLF